MCSDPPDCAGQLNPVGQKLLRTLALEFEGLSIQSTSHVAEQEVLNFNLLHGRLGSRLIPHRTHLHNSN